MYVSRSTAYASCVQSHRTRQPMGSLTDSMNLPHPVLDVPCLGTRSSAACDSIPPARTADLLDVRQLQQPSSPPALTRGTFKLQARSQHKPVPATAARCVTLSSCGTYSTLTCSDEESLDISHPSTSTGAFSTRAPSPSYPSSECVPQRFSCWFVK